MNKLFYPCFALILTTSTALAEIDITSTYDFLSNELLKINSSDAGYIKSEQPFAPLVNAFVADARNDKEAVKQHLQQLPDSIAPFFNQVIEDQYDEYDKKTLKEAQNKINSYVKDNNPYKIFFELSSIRDSVEYCGMPNGCADILISSYSFIKATPFITPRKKYESCREITSFYPLCKGEDYSADENPEKLKLAINYAQEPLKYYQEIRYKRPAPQPLPPIEKAQPPVLPEGKWNFKEALMYMEFNPQKAYDTLKQAQTLSEKLQLALFLQAYYPDKVKEIKDSLRDVVKDFDKGDQYIGYSRNYDKENFHKKFAEDLAENDKPVSMEYLIEVTTSASDKGLVDSQYAEIPCGLAKKMPEILSVTAPYYGGNRDNFIPRLECSYDYEHQQFPSMALQPYAALAEKADGYFLSTHQGSIRFGYYSAQNLKENQAFLGIMLSPIKTYKIKYPYEVWSYLSLENRKTFEEIKQSYLETHKIFMDYFTDIRKFSPEKAQILTEDLLFNYPFGTRCGDDDIPLNLRTMMIEQKDIEEIKQFTSSPTFLEKQKVTFPQDYIFGQDTAPAPLIHIAVQNPEYLKLLLELSRNMTAEEQQQNDLVADVNAKNNINKTPLMVAAQFNFFDSAKMLIEAGADINAVTQTEKYYGLSHDHRTALMYAAQNADLKLIQLLLNNGADKNMTDTKGYRAVDYLMGFASGDYNDKLSEPDFKKALELLW